jgi:hypothetical protein
MNAQINGAAGRAPARKTCRGRENLDRPLQLADLAPQLADLPGGLRGHPRRLPLIDSSLAQPPAQRLRAHPQPPGHRGDRRVLRRVIAGVLAHQPDRLGLRVLVVPDWHERAILPKVGSMHETRDGSRLSLAGSRVLARQWCPAAKRPPQSWPVASGDPLGVGEQERNTGRALAIEPLVGQPKGSLYKAPRWADQPSDFLGIQSSLRSVVEGPGLHRTAIAPTCSIRSVLRMYDALAVTHR